MEQFKNFLDELQERFAELIKNGTITQQQLEKGISIHKDWLYSSSIQRTDFIRALMELIIKKHPFYLKNCEEFNTDPDEPFDLIVSQRQNGMELAVIGNDQWSKLIVCNEKFSSNTVLQITPDELLEEIFLRTIGRTQWDMTKKLPKEINLLQVKKIFEEVFNAETIKCIKDGQRDGLIEMADNLVDYYKYLCEMKQDSKMIFAGYRDRVQSQRAPRKNGKGMTFVKKNKEIDFDKRDKAFKALAPLTIFVFHQPSKNNSSTPIPSDYIYLYCSPNNNGYLLVNEPYHGNEATRTVYLSEEALKDFLLPGQEMDYEFWENIAKHYINMSDEQFREEKHTCSLYHLDETRYLETLTKIITGQDEPKRAAIDPISRRVKKARSILFDGKKTTVKDIKTAADDVINEPFAKIDIEFIASLLSKQREKSYSGPENH